MSFRMSRLIPFLALILLAVPAVAQDEPAPEISFKATELVPGLYMLEGVGGFAGGNVGLLTGDDGVVMVDDSFPPHTDKLVAAVADVVKAPVDFVINTHVHGDHLGGNVHMHGQGATIVAHDNVRGRLVKNGMPTPTGTEPAPGEMLPVLTFADAVTFHLNGQESYVFHVADAHTDGDSIIHFKNADVIHMGDCFFNGIFPFIDVDNGGGVDGYIAAQEKVLAMASDKTQIIPGHGPLATKADLEASVKMLKAARESIGGMIKAGKSVDEILEAKPLADFEAQSWQFITTERMIRQVHRSLSGG
ncbi:MAG: MBL fold metallo-hydrolase [Acidobacteriota bacterium]